MTRTIRLTLLCFSISMLAGVAARADDTLPFDATFDEGWTVETLPGVSSAPQDRDLGLRRRGQWLGADGTAAIELTCMWLTTPPDVRAELGKIIEGLGTAVEAKGLGFEHDAPAVRRHGTQEWHEVEARMTLAGESIGRQRVAVRVGERCFLSATLAGTPEAYALQAAAFERAIAALREVPAR